VILSIRSLVGDIPHQREYGIAVPLRMFWKETKLYSVLSLKCPTCHEADLFVPQPCDPIRTGDFHGKCPVCGTKFKREPVFLYGAMYVSYAIGVALFVTAWLALAVLAPGVGVFGQATVVVGVLIVGSSYYYAFSKIIWANIFCGYDKAAAHRMAAGKTGMP